ncbi:MAG: aquaporin family protein [Sphingobacteriaceae bacterium]|nr:MAG: aquaporin family protein [Sphingobacteriaceae bacterium]
MSKNNWSFYVMEALAIAGFMLTAAFTTIFLEHPDSPLAQTQLAVHPVLRSLILAAVMGIYIFTIASSIGKLSGAHANPMLTWAFFRLKKITFADVCAYLAAQFLGAIATVLLLKLTMGKLFEHPLIDYSITKPKPGHSLGSAFIAEFVISFIFVIVTLFVLSSKKLEKSNAIIAGLLITLFLIFELPYSGMSMNPARSFASALVAWKWEEIWVYFVGPILGMLLATEIFKVWQKSLGVDAEGKPVISGNLFGSMVIPDFPSEEK